MRIDKEERIAGRPIREVRDYLREVGEDFATQSGIARWFKISEQAAGELLRAMCARQWLELEEKFADRGYYRLTMPGRALAGARLVPRLSRAKADQLLGEFLKRVAEVNSRNELAYFVREVHIFGSYLNPKAADLGDLDLAIDLPFRALPGRDLYEYSMKRADESGRRFGTWIRRLEYAENEVRRILRARSPYISLHPLSDIEATKSPSKLLFRETVLQGPRKPAG